ncbi:MAG: hypothetical protein HZB16_22145 [Armatimonadetes bacterium]|nr:hypothetical protein [Armatimonadota bacterium]
MHEDKPELTEVQHKPAWSPPVVVDLTHAQRGEGFSSCQNGSSDASGCGTGTLGSPMG